MVEPCPSHVGSVSREGFRRQGQQRGRCWMDALVGLDGVGWADEMNEGHGDEVGRRDADFNTISLFF